MSPRRPKSKSGRADDPLREEQKKLIEAQRALEAKAKRLNDLIENAPKKEEEIKRKRRERIRLDVATASRPVGIRGMGAQQKPVAEGRRRIPRRRSEQNLARIKFMILCLILFTIGLLIWNQIP